MAKRDAISIDKLATMITNYISEYNEDVSDSIAVAAEDRAQEMCKEIKSEAKRLFPKGTGDYAKGFKVQRENYNGRVVRVVWNKPHYRRVHLLEHGHATANGMGFVPGRPHMGPVGDKYKKLFEDDVKKIIKNGGAK